MSKCRGCGADIQWAVTKAGKAVPLNHPSEKRFVWSLGVDGLEDVILVDTYVSHFVTCPEVDLFRKEKS